MIRLLRTEDDGWYVSKHIKGHNHPLSEGYHEKMQWHSHSEIDPITKDFIRKLRENNVSLSRVCSILDGDKNLQGQQSFRREAVRTVCAKLAQESIKDDFAKTVSLLEDMRNSDPNFSVSFDVATDCKIKNMLWCSGKNKIDYMNFGDVVTFDTTYRTNLYKMPFGLFVGVNNHFQSVVFGGVLMTEETTEAFEWVFSTFLNLMDDVKPITVLTDQAPAMAAALRKVMPGTHHHWCRWHVLRNAKQKLGTVYTKYSGFKKEFNSLVTDVLCPTEFERGWAMLIKKYGLGDNTFLKRIYKRRARWAKPYFLDVFCAGMTSTQRSESANHMLKTYIPRACPMHLFVRRYNDFLSTRDAAEGKENHATRQRSRALTIGVPIEHHAKQIYTKAMLKRFVEELYRSGSYAIQSNSGNELFVLRNTLNSSDTARLTIDNNQFKVSCECGMMAHTGMPCRHALKVLVHLDRTELPESMIMRRWSPVKPASASNPASVSLPIRSSVDSESFRNNILLMAALKLVRSGRTNAAAFDKAMMLLDGGMAEVEGLANFHGIPENEEAHSPNSEITPASVEVRMSNTTFDRIPPNLKCPDRRSSVGRPPSSHLRAYKDGVNKKRGHFESTYSSKDIAGVDDPRSVKRVKKLADVVS